jgi:probable rRNA maturation factor
MKNFANSAKLPNTDITNTTKGKPPRLPFGFTVANYAEKILGKKYELSVVYVSPAKAKAINIQTRQKDYVPNILAFPLSKNSGELVLCLTKIKKEAPSFGYTYAEFLGFLFIHGMLHLDGFDHGSTMEKQEQKFLKMFKINKN